MTSQFFIPHLASLRTESVKRQNFVKPCRYALFQLSNTTTITYLLVFGKQEKNIHFPNISLKNKVRVPLISLSRKHLVRCSGTLTSSLGNDITCQCPTVRHRIRGITERHVRISGASVDYNNVMRVLCRKPSKFCLQPFLKK